MAYFSMASIVFGSSSHEPRCIACTHKPSLMISKRALEISRRVFSSRLLLSLLQVHLHWRKKVGEWKMSIWICSCQSHVGNFLYLCSWQPPRAPLVEQRHIQVFSRSPSWLHRIAHTESLPPLYRNRLYWVSRTVNGYDGHFWHFNNFRCGLRLVLRSEFFLEIKHAFALSIGWLTVFCFVLRMLKEAWRSSWNHCSSEIVKP